MIKKIRAPKVRNFLAEITSALPSDGLPTEAIIASLKAQHADAIEDESNDLIDMALIRIVSQTGSRQSNSMENVYPNLFGEYGAPPKVYVTLNAANGPERRMKNLPDVTIDEAERYVSQHRKPTKTLPKGVMEIARLAKDLKESGANLHDKIGESWDRKTKKSSG